MPLPGQSQGKCVIPITSIKAIIKVKDFFFFSFFLVLSFIFFPSFCLPFLFISYHYHYCSEKPSNICLANKMRSNLYLIAAWYRGISLLFSFLCLSCFSFIFMFSFLSANHCYLFFFFFCFFHIIDLLLFQFCQ